MNQRVGLMSYRGQEEWMEKVKKLEINYKESLSIQLGRNSTVCHRGCSARSAAQRRRKSEGETERGSAVGEGERRDTFAHRTWSYVRCSWAARVLL